MIIFEEDSLTDVAAPVVLNIPMRTDGRLEAHFRYVERSVRRATENRML